MLGNVAYIGYGFVGKACHKVFEHNSTAVIIDPKYSDTTIKDLEGYDTAMAFISVNAPTMENGKVDVSIVHNVLNNLCAVNYSGLVVIKSTIPPSELTEIFKRYSLNLVYSPEFLREKYWEEDALNPSMIILAGELTDCNLVKNFYIRHSHINTARVKFHITTPEQASLVKYAINTFLATKVVFFNQIYQLYKDINGGKDPDWDTWAHISSMICNDQRIGYSHMQVPGNNAEFGYGGSCFPKDVKALIGEDTGNHLSLLREIELANIKLRLLGRLDD